MTARAAGHDPAQADLARPGRVVPRPFTLWTPRLDRGVLLSAGVTVTTPAPVSLQDPPREQPAAPLIRTCRVELRKLFSLWRTRIGLLACVLAPPAFALVVRSASSLPTDTVFGRWLHQSGFALPLVVLGFAGGWALPLLATLMCGDVFAAEDRVGTWRVLLVTARSPRRVFAAKTVAAATGTVAVVLALAASSTLAGVLLGGTEPLPGLDGQLLGGAGAVRLITAAWACVLLPALAFGALGLLCSVAFGRSPLGLAVPVVLALAQQVLALAPLPAPVRYALPATAFASWRGLFTEPAHPGPVWVGAAVSLAWAVGAALLARRLFLRRDFANPAFDGLGRGALAGAAGALAALLVAASLVLAGVTGRFWIGPSSTGVDGAAVETALAADFAHLYQLQQDRLHNPPVTVAGIGAGADCDKGGPDVEDVGPGNDWRCIVSWHVAGSPALAQAVYQVDVSADGRFVADGDGPKQVNGWFTTASAQGPLTNPLWQFDGVLDLLSDARS